MAIQPGGSETLSLRASPRRRKDNHEGWVLVEHAHFPVEDQSLGCQPGEVELSLNPSIRQASYFSS
jgi:hypothetical protein